MLLASHAAIAIDQARLFEDSRELALTQERGRLARELHDAMSQSLFSLQLAADTAARLLPDDAAGAAAQLDVVRTLSAQIGGELRTMVDGLRPADLDRDGLAAVLRAQLTLAGRAHGVVVELDVDDPPDLDPDAEHEVLRIAQEAVTNALRHAPGTVRVRGRLPPRPRPGRGVLEVADDGTGFDPDARTIRSRRLGLTSMHERAASLGGRLTITSTRAPARSSRCGCRRDDVPGAGRPGSAS